MDLLTQLNSLPMFLIVGVVVAFIAVLCVVFLVRSWYFDVGQIGEDQLEDYASRRGIPVKMMRRFLSASL